MAALLMVEKKGQSRETSQEEIEIIRMRNDKGTNQTSSYRDNKN